MYRVTLALMSLLFLSSSAQAQGNSPAPGVAGKFGPQWRLLVGEWASDPAAGGGAGWCAFRFELGGHIMVRTNHAELPTSTDKPGGAHDDLMVIYPEGMDGQARATYWDNEGHMIEYTASWASDGSALIFLSKAGAGPQFRLTYKKQSADSLTVSFEVAPPGQTSAFKSYLSGRIRRQK